MSAFINPLQHAAHAVLRTDAVMAALIEAALSENPPHRLLLGSDAYGLVTHALQERLAAFERQRAVAFSTDVDQGKVAS